MLLHPRFANDGPFKAAWKLMENNTASFWTSRAEIANRLISDPNLAVFDFDQILINPDEFNGCGVTRVPKRSYENLDMVMFHYFLNAQ